MNLKFENSFKTTHYSQFFDVGNYQQLKPQLPVIDSIVEQVIRTQELPDLSKTYIVGVQHMLASTVSLFVDGFHRLGVPFGNMFFSGKCYSSAPEVEKILLKLGVNLMPTIKPEEPGQYSKAFLRSMELMWESFIKAVHDKEVDRIIVLDEGGRCLETIPEFIHFKYKIAGIEQTRGGLYSEVLNNLLFPVIEVASCVAKKQLESPLIAESVIKRVKAILPQLKLTEKSICGIIGNGAIGYAIAQYLLSSGYTVAIYDEMNDVSEKFEHNNLFRVESIKKLVANTQFIFGCTGKDITENLDFLNLMSDKFLISCSSEDKEFLSLLKMASKQNIIVVDPMSDITFLGKYKKKITLLRGGFPINFDNSPECVPSNDIQLTRGLVLGAFIQAINCTKKHIKSGSFASRQMLDPYIQSYVVAQWKKTQPKDRYSKQLLECFDSIEWIIGNSDAKYYSNDFFTKTFDSPELAVSLKAKL